MLKGNDELITEILTTDYAMFYRIAFGYVHNEADAQDIVQECAYKAIYHSAKLKKQEYARTWICRILINEAISFLRKKKRELPGEMENQPQIAVTKEDTTDLHAAMKGLKQEEKTIIMLRFFEDMKIEEIARIMNLSVNTVKSRLYRTLAKLKIEIEGQEV